MSAAAAAVANATAVATARAAAVAARTAAAAPISACSDDTCLLMKPPLGPGTLSTFNWSITILPLLRLLVARP